MPSDRSTIAGSDEAGPALDSTIHEVRALFPSDAALQEAIGQLTVAGFDRADLSLPRLAPPAREATPEQGAENPHTDIDNRQMRTMHASMAGSAAALLAAGVVIGTGGVAAPAVGAAVGAGLAAGALSEAGSHAADAMQHDERQALAREGRLVLSVRTASPSKQADAQAVLERTGATEIVAVRRVDNAIDSSRWTG
ncbi:MAG TPA: hypothetical protein VME92_20795 [Acetobacteraceae bacterium]|nr:hypothetical protein [Acetobacteraceae bacterium]